MRDGAVRRCALQRLSCVAPFMPKLLAGSTVTLLACHGTTFHYGTTREPCKRRQHTIDKTTACGARHALRGSLRFGMQDAAAGAGCTRRLPVRRLRGSARRLYRFKLSAGLCSAWASPPQFYEVRPACGPLVPMWTLKDSCEPGWTWGVNARCNG